jgi:2-methylisocitrate lyase-like PEP mutase family enzyme
MEKQIEYANLLRSLHKKDYPLVLFNIWDAGSAILAEKAGSKAIVTSSWSVAAAHGYEDGQKLPIDLVIENAARIVKSVNLPVTIDIESGYGETLEEVASTIAKIITTGSVGINIEDQIIGQDILYSCEEQCQRIKVARSSTEIPIFINARTDIFLKVSQEKHTDEHLEEALFRASEYKKSGADCLFVPGLQDEKFIKKLCEALDLPVNIMISEGGLSAKKLVELGASRISYGPIPYFKVIENFNTNIQNALKI